MLTEQELLDFDRSRLAHWSREDEERALADHRELFLNHLAMAKHIDGWVSRLEPDLIPFTGESFGEGYVQALREIAAHLRQGDYLPGGAFYEG